MDFTKVIKSTISLLQDYEDEAVRFDVQDDATFDYEGETLLDYLVPVLPEEITCFMPAIAYKQPVFTLNIFSNPTRLPHIYLVRRVGVWYAVGYGQEPREQKYDADIIKRYLSVLGEDKTEMSSQQFYDRYLSQIAIAGRGYHQIIREGR